jgi:palmitoyltransferase ZDHHC9/14/18
MMLANFIYALHIYDTVYAFQLTQYLPVFCYDLFIGNNSSNVSQLVMNGANVGIKPTVPTDIDDVMLTVTGGSGDVGGGGESCSPTEMTDLDLTEVVMCDTNVVPLSASRLRLLQDTTMIESALDLDSLEESSVGAGSQAGLLKLSAV